eukprot:CAMPEP_0197542808 /NCGR_PEP_ID=MMETSP1318-20131121/67902_1 /TAXON_ID=552666 /ORGANISM="Partenskyella glossopodia, Strain RCC365" /LENGTH=923 /DNA_ID=CAMNT_0043102097 /DNA_START=16 /DNA_END=2787 /DNA_ORIENTATION=-
MHLGGDLPVTTTSQSCPNDPRYSGLDPKMQEQVRKRERLDKEQRLVDGRYVVLERLRSDGKEERLDSGKGSNIMELIKTSSPDKVNSRDSSHQYIGLDSKPELNEHTTETDSLAEPMVRSIVSVTNESEPYSRSLVSVTNESVSEVKDSDLESAASDEEEYWDDTDSEEEEQNSKRGHTKTMSISSRVTELVPLMNEFVVGVKGSKFGAGIKMGDGKGFPIPSSSPEHFQIAYERKNFLCKALDPQKPIIVTRKTHHVKIGDRIDFDGGHRLIFSTIARIQLGEESGGDKAVLGVELSVQTSDDDHSLTTAHLKLKIPAEGVKIGTSSDCQVRFPTDTQRAGGGAVFAVLEPEKDNFRKDLVLRATDGQIFHVNLYGQQQQQQQSQQSDVKAAKKSISDSEQEGDSCGGVVSCYLETGDVISAPEDPSLRYTVTKSLVDRSANFVCKHGETWGCVKDCAYVEEGNFTVENQKEQQDRVAVKDRLGGDPFSGLFGVFDGHGGRDVADVAAALFPVILEQELEKEKARSEKYAAATADRPSFSTLLPRRGTGRGLSMSSAASIATSISAGSKTLSAMKEVSELRTFFNQKTELSPGTTPRSTAQYTGKGIRLSFGYLTEQGGCGLNLSGQEGIPVEFFEASEVHRGPTLALKHTCSRVANLMKGLGSEMGHYQGSTVQACLIAKEKKSGVLSLHSASIGDSGAILIRSGKPVEVSCISRHKPDHPDEKLRIEKAGGRVSDGRLMNMLAVSRALGDLSLAEWGLSSEPHFSETQIGPDDSHLVIASDGVWDFISSKKVTELVLKAQTAMDACSNIISFITHGNKNRSKDNISLVVAELRHGSSPKTKPNNSMGIDLDFTAIQNAKLYPLQEQQTDTQFLPSSRTPQSINLPVNPHEPSDSAPATLRTPLQKTSTSSPPPSTSTSKS